MTNQTAPQAVAQVSPRSLPSLPTALPNHFMLGLTSNPQNIDWMTNNGAHSTPWDARYQYLAGGVNTDGNWKTWQDPTKPPGQFALDYMNDSYDNGYLPVFTWYQLLQSDPQPPSGTDEPTQDYNNLNNASTMYSYFSDFKLLMDRAKQFNKTVIVHIEPDLWGFLEQMNQNPNPNNISAAVASSNYGDVVASLPNTAAGFAQALVALRDKYATNVLLAYHISPWATSQYGDLGTDPDAGFNVQGTAQNISNFYFQTGADFDLLFYDIADRDAAFYQYVRGDSSRWWDATDTTFPNYSRFHQFVAYMTANTGKRGILWQLPLGNTIYRTMNNTAYHYQDNKVQYYLNTSNQHIQDAANSGLIGLLFGSGGETATIYDDQANDDPRANDGITNPAPINGNNATSSYSDDDGGYFRLQGAAYYTRGPVTFGSPQFNSSPGSGSTISLSAQIGSVVTSTLTISNTGGGPALSVNAPTLGGSNPGSFSVSPNTAFNIASGGVAVKITIQCNPAARTTYNATLGYTTNDTAHSQVNYSLNCTGLAPHFNSSPYAPDATITLKSLVNQPVSTTLQIGNTGDTGTSLSVNTASLSQSQSGIFTVSPTSAFSLNQGATARQITINCTPQAAETTYTGTLTFPVTNDPNLGSAVYHLTCNTLTPLTVTVADQTHVDGKLTLTEALASYAGGQNIILFNVAGNQVTLSTSLQPNRGAVIIDGGGCTNDQPAITLTGGGLTFSLGGGLELRNIKLNRVKLIASGGGGGNKLGRCLVVSNTNS